MAAISELEWTSINGIDSNDEADFMAQFMSIPSSSLNMANHDHNSNSYFYPTLSNSNSIMDVDFYMGDVNNGSSYLIDGDEFCLNQGDSEIQVLEPVLDVKNNPSEKSKKRTRKNESNVKRRKNQKLGLMSINEDRQTSSSCSEDDSNVSQELNGVCSSLIVMNGKTRASRGSATDPQSLYARKRRERINERLRILQTLVPNGTKVDISTMLEEAVQYVKFLQVQIKLLSSDDLWMYAPIAYNGKDIGLDMKIAMSRNP